MAVSASTVDVTVTVTLWVPLDASGDLTSGVEAVLGDGSDIAEPNVYDIDSVTPRATDIQVTAVVGLAVTVAAEGDGATEAREQVADTFGVMSVDRVRLE